MEEETAAGMLEGKSTLVTGGGGGSAEQPH
jgi:hypothetical protein